MKTISLFREREKNYLQPICVGHSSKIKRGDPCMSSFSKPKHTKTKGMKKTYFQKSFPISTGIGSKDQIFFADSKQICINGTHFKN